MRLYLSSYGLGNDPTQLTNLVGEKKHAGIVLNSLDWGTKEARDERLLREQKALEELGFTTEELDLRKYFGSSEALQSDLNRFNLVWVRGGNSFVLRRAMKQSKFDYVIKELLERDLLVYGGFSAGSVVLAPTLKGIELVDDPHIVPEDYENEIPWEGLNVIDYSIAPHFRSNHPESEAINHVVEYFEEHKMPYKALKDGQAIVIEGEHTQIIG